jgi:hypothetical protein
LGSALHALAPPSFVQSWLLDLVPFLLVQAFPCLTDCVVHDQID